MREFKRNYIAKHGKKTIKRNFFAKNNQIITYK